MPMLILSALVAVVPQGELEGDATPPPPVAERLVERALADNRAHALLADLVAAAPQRLAGSPGMARAREWAKATMTALGLENVRVEPVTVPRWERGETATLTGDGVRFDVAALGGSIGTPEGGITAPVLMVRSFEELRARADEAKGRIVFFNRPMPRVLRNTFRAYGAAVPQRGNGAIEAAKVGAVAAIVRSMTTLLDDLPHTGTLRYEDGVPPIPAAAISTNGAEALAARIAEQGTVELTLRLDCRPAGEGRCGNVVGEIRGTRAPEEIVLIGAHLDAWDLGHGAHDDGAGCVHCLEAVRLILACGLRPARTVRVVLFTNEENGLRGARGYAEAHADELAAHVAALETDRGGFEPKGFDTTLEEAARRRLVPALAPLRELGMGALIEGGGGADISVLRPHGVPLFGLIVADHRYFDFHHSAADVLGAVNERELALGAAAVAAMTVVLADPELFPR